MNLNQYVKHLLHKANRKSGIHLNHHCIASNLLIEDNIQKHKDDTGDCYVIILDYQTVYYLKNVHIKNGVNLDENHDNGWKIHDFEEKCNLIFDCESNSENIIDVWSPKNHYQKTMKKEKYFQGEEKNYSRGTPFIDILKKVETAVDIKLHENHNDGWKITTLADASYFPKNSNSWRNHDQTISKNQINSVLAEINNTEETYLSDINKLKDSLIIKDIVMNRYGDVLNQYIVKTLRRKQKHQSMSNHSIAEVEQKLERPTSLNAKSLYNSEMSRSYTKTPDSGLATSEDLLSGNCISEYDETVRYSPTMFLREALGEEYMNSTYDSEQKNEYCSTPLTDASRQNCNERSIRSSEVSTILSTIYGVESLYSTIDKSKKKVRNMQANRPLFCCNPKRSFNYGNPEKSNTNSKFEELTNAIAKQVMIIVQVQKAISFCKQSLTFLGSLHHLEAEKHLLVANYRKEALENELNITYEEMEENKCFGTIHIEDLLFSTHTDKRCNISHYYICLLHSGTTVLSSEIVLPDRNGDIVFTKSFQFTKLLSDFEIHIKIFSMELKHKKRLYGGKQLGRLVKMSSFHLLGLCKITIADLHTNNHFFLENVAHDGKLSSFFTANIRSSIQANYNVSAFLTIGTSNVLWNRRWCTLDGYYLKYWNYPTEEYEKEPLGMIDLSKNVSRQLVPVDKTICSRPRTMMLQIKLEQDIKQIFLQADNCVELRQWKEYLNSVLISLNNWKYGKHI